MLDVEHINALAREIHQNAVDHGWWEEERPYYEIAALIHSELSEALEEYRDGHDMIWTGEDGKPEGIAVELADAVIRCLDYLGKDGYTFKAWTYRDYTMTEILNMPAPWVVYIAHRKVSFYCLNECVYLIDEWLSARDIDLWDLVRVKHEYNKTRPYRHGGKVC